MVLVTDRSLTAVKKVSDTYKKMTKIEIIRAAFKAWGREFYIDTSLTQVAKELGVSKPALYRYFRNKQALMDAMYNHYFDDYSAFIRADFKRAGECTDRYEAIFILIRANTEYYARNGFAFLFSLFYVYADRQVGMISKQLTERGVDMTVIQRYMEEDFKDYPLVLQIVGATLTFAMSVFFKSEKIFQKSPSEEAIKKIVSAVEKLIECGLCFNKEKLEAMEFDDLEAQVSGAVHTIEENELLQAVAGVIAEAGLWNVSMEKVARRSGLSKSGLYAHFKSKQDMLHRLFMTEFDRIIGFARESMKQSAVQEEKFYLCVFSIADYLRSRPAILIAMDWIRTRQPGFAPPEEKPEFFRVFEGIEALDEKASQDSDFGSDWLPQWVLFLIVSILMYRPKEMNFSDIPNSSVRTLYRFLTLGIKGFYK
jgi:AcrR family transcriptional regulator